MKKLLTCALAAAFTLSVTGCSKEEPKPNPANKPADTKPVEKPKEGGH